MSIYEGSENYIFVSYAHKDSGIVLPIIDALNSAGFRVWFDRGIEAGTEWPAYIEEHLLSAERVLVFLSPSSVDSVNCRNEINLAAKENIEMLVVYLEETQLKHGLGLQLGTKQSLFRHRHENDSSFIDELISAKILQCCKTDAVVSKEDIKKINIPKREEAKSTVTDKGDYVSTVQSRIGGQSMISRVGTMPSNDPMNPWPKGSYAQTIDIRKFNSLHFHCNLLHSEAKATSRSVGIRIFDENDALVFENVEKIQFSQGNDKFSLGWKIKDQSGMPQAVGSYTAVIWIDDSRAVEYPFRLIDSAIVDNMLGNNMPKTEVSQEVETLKKNLRFPIVALYQLGSWLSFIMMCVFAVTDGSFLIVAALGLDIFFMVKLCIELKFVLIKNGLARFFLVFTVGLNFFLGVYLIVKGIQCQLNRKMYVDRLAILGEKLK